MGIYQEQCVKVWEVQDLGRKILGKFLEYVIGDYASIIFSIVGVQKIKHNRHNFVDADASCIFKLNCNILV